MADVHVTGAARCTRARALERRGRQLPGDIAEECAALAMGREHARDVEVRAHDQLRCCVIASDIREQKQRQESAPAAVHIHPPPSLHVVAAVDVATRRRPDPSCWGTAPEACHRHPFTGTGTAGTEEGVVHAQEGRRLACRRRTQGRRDMGSARRARSTSPRSRGSTPRPRSSLSMTSTHALTASGATAPRTTTNPSMQNSPIDAAISPTRRRSRSETPADSTGPRRSPSSRFLHRALVPESNQVSVGIGELGPRSPNRTSAGHGRTRLPVPDQSLNVVSTSAT